MSTRICVSLPTVAYDDVTSHFNLCSVKIPYYGTCLYTVWISLWSMDLVCPAPPPPLPLIPHYYCLFIHTPEEPVLNGYPVFGIVQCPTPLFKKYDLFYLKCRPYLSNHNNAHSDWHVLAQMLKQKVGHTQI